jgi:hypothetical protein
MFPFMASSLMFFRDFYTQLGLLGSKQNIVLNTLIEAKFSSFWAVKFNKIFSGR